ncbi:cytochrome c oxidase assembly protein (plasmid) [Deinococcus radiomollis]|uniref:cytochrome c oxidase assembly protein n=1 Tax=Deinococcus radiomollis TaxID=468916 RepID=UPI003891509F
MKVDGTARALLWKLALISVLAAVYLFRLGTFSGHMTAHLLLSLATPPLALAASGWQPRVPAWLGGPQVPGWLGFLALNAVTVLVHLPGMNRAVMMDPALTLLEGLAFLASGLLFWSGVKASAAHPITLNGAWGAVGLLTAQMAVCALLGATITFSRGVYMGRPDDVSLGGVLMWVAGGVVYMVWGMVYVTRALRQPEPTLPTGATLNYNRKDY